VRRIEALTGAAAEAYLAQEEGILREAAAALRTTPSELPARIVSLVEERRRLERELSEVRRALANAGPSTRSTEKRIGDVAFDGRLVDDVPGRELKSLADDLKRRIRSGVVAVVSRADGKAAIVVGVTRDLTDRFNAVELVRLGAAALGGKGGGGRDRSSDCREKPSPGRGVSAPDAGKRRASDSRVVQAFCPGTNRPTTCDIAETRNSGRDSDAFRIMQSWVDCVGVGL
jgi:alanyl-tRNA synthetase